MSGRRLLVIGRSGQLARALQALARPGLQVAALGREVLDLAAAEARTGIAEALQAHRPFAVINAAAYTAVDRAEAEPDTAFALNREGPRALALACAQAGVRLVHLSTDYVFDGSKAAPYVEADAVAPLGVYGRSKAEGEAALLAAFPEAAILRTSWVFGPTGANFVKTMLRLAETRDVIGVVHDQLGRPTCAGDLAEACIAAAHGEASGVFHYAGDADASWAEFAETIFALSAERGGPIARVRRITSAEFPTPALRPANSRLDSTCFATTFGLPPSDWRKGLARTLDALLLSE